MPISSYSTRRNFHRGDRRTITERHTTRDVTDALSDALANVSAKEIADASGSSLRAAENAKGGINAMSLAHFLNACQTIPELKAMALKFIGHEETINPDRERALAMLVNSYARSGA
jgi:hypothetical protein